MLPEAARRVRFQSAGNFTVAADDLSARSLFGTGPRPCCQHGFVALTR